MQHGHSAGHTTEHHGPGWISLVVALMLGSAAVISGITAWRSAVHHGVSQTKFTESIEAVNRANTLGQNSASAVNEERSLFIAWEQAKALSDTTVADEIWGIMSIPTQKSVSWWIDQPVNNRPTTPFSAANPLWTTPSKAVEARAGDIEANEIFARAENELETSHNLELLEALLAIALLTGGLAGLIRSTSAQFVLLGVAGTSVVLALGGLVVLW